MLDHLASTSSPRVHRTEQVLLRYFRITPFAKQISERCLVWCVDACAADSALLKVDWNYEPVFKVVEQEQKKKKERESERNKNISKQISSSMILSSFCKISKKINK